MPRINKRPETRGAAGASWIIVDRTAGKERVWIGGRESCIFATEADAVRELNLQKAAMRPGMRTGYRVERLDGPGGAFAAREGAKAAEVNSLEAAALARPYADDDGD